MSSKLTNDEFIKRIDSISDCKISILGKYDGINRKVLCRCNVFGGKVGYEKQLERDGRKLSKCLENGVKLLYFTHYNFKSKVPSYTFISVDELFNYINTFNHGTIIEKHT